MKSLLWKELRQLAPWSAAMLVAMSAVMIGSLIAEADKFYYGVYRQAWFQIWLVIAFGAPCVAFVTAVLQTVLEIRRDQWAFLMHRGLSATRIFQAKALAGLSVYATVTLLPAIGAFAWCARGGIERQPLSWYHTLPLLASWLASAAFYFAALLAVVWHGPWYFSRLLPLVSPVLISIGVVAYTSEMTEYVPLRLFAALALAVAVLGIAAWGVFVRSGESAGRARLANACLGVPLFVAWFGGCLCLFAAAGACYEALGKYYGWEDSWRERESVSFVPDREGHVLQVTTRFVAEGRSWSEEFVGVVDLDDPQSRAYESLAGQTGKIGRTLPAWKALPMANVFDRGAGLFAFAKPSNSPRRILARLGQTARSAGSRTNWVYSSADGWIYGYLEEPEHRDGRTLLKPPRLIEAVGPDGFVEWPAHPQRRFGALLANSGNPWDNFGRHSWAALLRAPGDSSRFCLLFDEGLFLFDPAARSVQPLVVADAGRKIRCLTRLEDSMAVVYDNSISLHAPRAVCIGTRKDPETGAIVDDMIDVPGELQYSFPLPEQVASFSEYSFGRLPGRDSIVFNLTDGWSMFDGNRFIEMRLDGSIVQNRAFVRSNVVPRAAIPPLGAVASFAPPGPMAAAIAMNELQQALHGEAPGTYGRLIRNLPVGMLFPSAVLLGSALGCGWWAGRTARRYGFDARTRRVWQGTATLFGPAALLTLWLLHDWPARESCRVCASRRPVDRDHCPRCGSPAPVPAADGTEIIVGSPVQEAVALV